MRAATRFTSVALAVALVLGPGALAASPRAELVVNSTGVASDANPGNGVCETAVGNGVCTLRAAVEEANALAGADIVTIVVTGTITLSSALVISDDLTIRSGLAGSAKISGGGASGLFAVSAPSYPDVTFDELWLEQASSSSAGSTVLLDVAGDVTFTHCDFRSNASTGGGAVGVGVWAGNLLFDGCAFADNSSTASGAAIAIFGNPIYQRGTLEIRASTFNSNHSGVSSEGGGAVAVLTTDWDLTITDTSFLYNSDLVDGGGAIFLSGSSLDPITARIERASFVGNAAPGGSGGAISGSSAQLVLVNCNFADNTALAGGAAVHVGSGSLALSFTTLADNDAGSGGGGLYAAAGVQLRSAATVFSLNAPLDCAGGATVSGDANLASDASCIFSGVGNLSSTVALLGPTEAGLGGLLFNPPVARSPAIDSAGEVSCLDVDGDPVVVDIVGDPRPTDGDGDGVAACDRGAREIPANASVVFADGFELGTSARWSSTVS